MLRDGGEMALLDVREEGVFSTKGHPLFANCLPLSRLELMIRDLVPRQHDPHRRAMTAANEGLADARRNQARR